MIRVLIIPEDPVLDEHILRPIVEQLFKDLNRKARIDVLTNPRLRGDSQALDPEIVADVIRDYSMGDLFLLLVDGDCNRSGNAEKAQAREGEHRGKLFACLAKEEIEVWMLGLYRSELNAPWTDIRSECDPKERFAEPFLTERKWASLVGKGRKRAMRALDQAKWRGLLEVCQELAELKRKVQAWFETDD